MSESSVAKRGLPARVKMRHGAHFVDDLAARHESPVGRHVPLSAIEPNRDQPRSDFGDLSDLVASIRDRGVLEPILVRPAGEGERADGRLRIIAGERRYRAALEAGLFEVPVIELDVSDQEALEVALVENLQRKDLTPFEEADGYRALADRHGYTQEQVAKAVGKSRSSVAESLALAQVPETVREAADRAGIRAKSALLEIAKAEDESEMLELIAATALRGAGRDDLRRATRSGGKASAAGRKKPYTFKFRAPDKRYSLSLTFRQSTVEKQDLISALEGILDKLRSAPE